MIRLEVNCGFRNADCGMLLIAVPNLKRGGVAFPRPKSEVRASKTEDDGHGRQPLPAVEVLRRRFLWHKDRWKLRGIRGKQDGGHQSA